VSQQSKQVGDNYLIVKPSVSLSPAPPYRAPGIFSRAEIARRREANEQARKAALAVVDTPAPVALVEMDEADVTPLPKNKGGRPRKEC
jgi:hypothetical protein